VVIRPYYQRSYLLQLLSGEDVMDSDAELEDVEDVDNLINSDDEEEEEEKMDH